MTWRQVQMYYKYMAEILTGKESIHEDAEPEPLNHKGTRIVKGARIYSK